VFTWAAPGVVPELSAGGRVARRLDGLLEQIAGEHGWQIVADEVMPDDVHLVGCVSEVTVRRYIEHQWDAVLAS
jgi:REP element-mobilizing transposase RayT